MMFFRLSPGSKVKRILLVSLSNLGDVVMTLPVIDHLKETFPRAALYVSVGPKARGLFAGNPHIDRVIIYDKSMSWLERWQWVLELRRERFDMLVDLRNSMLPFLLNASHVTRPALAWVRGHMKDKHLRRLDLVLAGKITPKERYGLYLPLAARKKVDGLLGDHKDYILFVPGAADDKKRWSEDGFVSTIKYVIEKYGRTVVVVGDGRDCAVVERILKGLSGGVINLSGATDLLELAVVVSRASLAVTNDSGVMHMASYFNIPTIALFGPTDPSFTAPWCAYSVVIKKSLLMADILPVHVIGELDRFLGKK